MPNDLLVKILSSTYASEPAPWVYDGSQHKAREKFCAFVKEVSFMGHKS